MKNYQVVITEKLQKTITVNANSKEEAECKTLLEWKDQKHVLDSRNFVNVTFIAQRQKKEKER